MNVFDKPPVWEQAAYAPWLRALCQADSEPPAWELVGLKHRG